MKDDHLGICVALELGSIYFETRVKSYLLHARRTGWLVFEHLPWAKTWCQDLYQRLSNYTVPLRSAGDLVTKQIMTQKVWGLWHNLTWAVYSKFSSISSHAGLMLRVLRPHLEQQASPHHVAAHSFYTWVEVGKKAECFEQHLSTLQNIQTHSGIDFKPQLFLLSSIFFTSLEVNKLKTEMTRKLLPGIFKYSEADSYFGAEFETLLISFQLVCPFSFALINISAASNVVASFELCHLRK